LTSLDLSNFNIENVTHIKNIFNSLNKDCKIITENEKLLNKFK